MSASSASPVSVDPCLLGGGEAGALMRSIDWSKSALGPVGKWPTTLRTSVGIMLASTFAMRILWGPKLIMLHNDGYRPVLGASKYPGAMGSRTAESFAEVWDVVGPMFHRVLAGEAVAMHDGSLPLDRNGYLEECFFTLSYSPLSDDQGGVGGVLGVIYETTQRVVAERRLRALRRLAAAVSVARTADAVCKVAARAFAEAGEDVPFSLFYLRQDDDSGRLIASSGVDDQPAARPEVVPSFSRLALWPVPEHLRAGPHPEPVKNAIVLPLQRPGGEGPYGWMVAGISPRRALDAEYETFFELAREHVAAAIANALAILYADQERVRLRSFLQEAPTAIAVFRGPSLVFDLANDSYCRLVGRRSDKLVGQPAAEALPELEEQGIWEIPEKVYRTGEPFAVREYAAQLDRKGDGVLEEAYFDWIAQATRDPHGTIDGVLNISIEVTDQVIARRALEASRKHLEDVVAQMKLSERALRESDGERQVLLARAERALSSAESASRAKDEFLAIVSHELRNPLNAMLGWTRMLRSGALSEERAVRALETIERNATNQAQLIEDLLDVSRVVAGKLPLDVQTVTFARVIEAAIDSARPAIEARGLRLSVVLDTEGVLSGDPARLQQVVWNLLTNATKFTPRGGSVRIELRRDESYLELSVTDSGQGISPTFLDHVFDRFKQADPSTTRQHGGLGRGRAIAKNLVEMHGGTIEAHSEGLGKGASFIVRVPVAAMRRSNVTPVPVRAAETPVRLESPIELRGLRVLVVDDDPDARDLVMAVLADCGALVTTAPSVALAMAALEKEAPDVILSDIGMPEEDGYSLVSRVRAMARSRGGATPAACLTGYTSSEDRRKALSAGFNMHLAKPVDPSELIAVVANLSRMAKTLRSGD